MKQRCLLFLLGLFLCHLSAKGQAYKYEYTYSNKDATHLMSTNFDFDSPSNSKNGVFNAGLMMGCKKNGGPVYGIRLLIIDSSKTDKVYQLLKNSQGKELRNVKIKLAYPGPALTVNSSKLYDVTDDIGIETGKIVKSRGGVSAILNIFDSNCASSNHPAQGTEQHRKYIAKQLSTYNIESITIEGKTYNLKGFRSAATFKAMMLELEKKMNAPGYFGLNGTTSSRSTSVTPRNNTPSSSTSQSNSSSQQQPKTQKTEYVPWNINGFNGAKEYEPVGVSVGYVSKQWRVKGNGSSETIGVWDDSKKMSGVQIGVVGEPQFKYGMGMFFGIFYEYYYSKDQPWKRVKTNPDVDPRLHGDYNSGKTTRAAGYSSRGDNLKYTQDEHALYVPVRFEYRGNFSKDFQLFAWGGVSMDIGLGGTYTIWNESEDYEVLSLSGNDIYDNPNLTHGWKSFNASYEFGGGIRLFRRYQLGFTMSRGFLDMSENDDYKVYQDKNMMLTFAVML